MIKRLRGEWRRADRERENWKDKYEFDPLNEDNDGHYQSGRLFGPKGTPYEGGIFLFSLSFPREYPYKPFGFNFRTKIFHPDINKEGRIPDMECSYHKGMLDHWKPVYWIVDILNDIRRRLADTDNCDSAHQNPSDRWRPELFQKQPKLHWARAKADTLTYATTPSSLDLQDNKLLILAEKEEIIDFTSVSLRESKLFWRLLCLNNGVSLRVVKLRVDKTANVSLLISLVHVSHIELNLQSPDPVALFAFAVELKKLNSGGCNFLEMQGNFETNPIVIRSIFSTLQKYHFFWYGKINTFELIPDTVHAAFFSRTL